jgi:hypothetical protein
MPATEGMTNQRWTAGLDSYRPAGEVIRTAEYDVAPIHRDIAKAFVLRHHYSGTFPAARFCHGLARAGDLVGVAVFSHPVQDSVLTNVFPFEDARAGVELGRFVLLDSVPGNGETWFLARAFDLLRGAGVEGVVSFSDPVRRRAADGHVVLPGHVGTIYQAHNGVYFGRGTARTLRMLPDGTVFSDRAKAKVQARDCGWAYAARQLEAHGAAPLGEGEDGAAWLRLWLPRVTRAARHHGCHKYAWGLDRAVRRALPRTLPYPKTIDEEVAA